MTYTSSNGHTYTPGSSGPRLNSSTTAAAVTTTLARSPKASNGASTQLTRVQTQGVLLWSCCDGSSSSAVDQMAPAWRRVGEFRGVRTSEYSGGIFKKCVNSQAVYPLSEQHGLEAQERR